jgi:WD40 repeat protein
MSVVAAAPPSPFKGLAPFEDSDRDALLFFGREREGEVIAANLIAARITVLYGPSGVGKSSVLRAGVAHRLRREQEAEVVVFSTWTGDPVTALIEAVGESGDSLVDALADAADRAGGDLYLILDQFEECFLYHRRGGRFAEQLAEVLRRPGLRVNVLIGIREDALARLDALKASIPSLLANRLRLERLDRAAGMAAIVGPVTRYNELVGPADRVDIELELEDAILDQVAAGRVELSVAGRGVTVGGSDEGRIEAPYLQLVLSRLWEVEAEHGSRTLHLATLHELGGAEHIVEDHLERAMAELSPREKGAAAAMYNFLVTPSGTKIAHGVRDLAGYAAVEEDEATEVLQRLTAERIVRASSTNGPSTTRYEIFHDVLADAVLAWRTRFEAERRLIEERTRHERRQRRLVAIGAAALLGLAVMAAIAVYAFAQRSNARHQTAVAQVERAKAQRQAGLADRQKRNALRQAAVARGQKAKARLAEERAQRSAAEANAQRLEALSQKAIAEGNKAEAQRLAALAAQAQSRAEGQAAFAKREEQKAVRAEALATRQKNVVRAEQLEADARVLLAADPEASVKRSLRAVLAFRTARRTSPVALEDTLRQGLLGLRLNAVLPGGGRVRVTRFSPDGSLLLVAGTGGARLYDRAHAFRRRRLAPSSTLADAAFSPDGRLVAGAGIGADHAAHVWDAQTGLQLYTLPHDDGVLSVDFSPNGRYLATGSRDGTARVWNVAGGLLLATFHHPAGSRSNFVQLVSFSPDSSRLLTVGGDRFARVYDLTSRDLAMSVNNTVLINSARFSHDGTLIATAGADLFVRIWNASTGQLRYVLRGTGRVNDLTFSPDDALLATAGGNDTIARVWNLAERSSSAIITAHKSGIESVAFNPDGGSVVTTGRDGNAYVAASEGGFTQASLLGHQGPVNSAAYSPDGQTIVTGSDDGSARLWDARVDRSGPTPVGIPRLIGAHGLAVNAVAFSPDGRRLLSAGDDGTSRLWGPGDRVVILRQAGPVNSGSFSQDGKRVITASDDGTAAVWRVADGQPVARLAHGGHVTAARLSPNGRLAVTAGSDGTAKLWNVARGALLHPLQHEAAVNDARFSPNGQLLVTASDDHTAAIWRVSDGMRLRTLNGHADAVIAAVFSRNGQRVATASADSTARIWNVRSGKTEHVLAGHTDALTSLAFNRDASLLATASKDTDARVWNVRSGSQVALLRIHVSAINDIAFSHDGRWLATAGPTAVGIWETRTKGPWPALPMTLVFGPTRPINVVAFSPRGWRIAFGSRDGSVRIYSCSLCGGVRQLTAVGRARLGEIVRVKP